MAFDTLESLKGWFLWLVCCLAVRMYNMTFSSEPMRTETLRFCSRWALYLIELTTWNFHHPDESKTSRSFSNLEDHLFSFLPCSKSSQDFFMENIYGQIDVMKVDSISIRVHLGKNLCNSLYHLSQLCSTISYKCRQYCVIFTLLAMKWKSSWNRIRDEMSLLGYLPAV